MTVIPFDRYAVDMEQVVAEMRRRTHIVVATNKRTGEVLSRHARPRAEAVAYRNEWQQALGGEWTVKAVRARVRRFR